MSLLHLDLSASASERLVHDDRDRFALVRRIVLAHGDRLLAWGLTDMGLQIVVEGESRLEAALLGYSRAFNRRHRSRGPLVRGAILAIPVWGEEELGRAIESTHANPGDPIDHPWSSARAFVGLSRAAFPNVARALELLGRRRRRVALADLEPALAPCASPPEILDAVARVFGLDPVEVAGTGRAAALAAARAVYVRLGNLESYRDRQLASLLGRTRSRVSQLGSGPVDLEAARMARTLLRRGVGCGLSTDVNPWRSGSR